MRNKLAVFLLSFMLLILAACGGGASDDAQADAKSSDSGGEKRELIASHFLPDKHPIQANILDVFLEELEEKSNGRITHDMYSAGALGEPSAQYDMAVTGTADIALSVHGFTPGRFPLVSIVELPFIVESAGESTELLWTLYEEFDEFQAEHEDTTPLWLFTVDPAQLLSANVKIEKPEDLEGLRVRSPSPLANEIIETLGATPVSMPMGEVYDSLQKGVVDVALAPISEAKDYNLHEVIDYVTFGNFSVTPFFTVMNTDTFASFSEEDQQLIKDISGSQMVDIAAESAVEASTKGRELAEENGVEIIDLSDDMLKEWEAALQPVYDNWVEEMESQGYPGKEIFERMEELTK